MEEARTGGDRAERLLRMALLVLVWLVWLALRALWALLVEVLSFRGRRRVRRVLALALGAALALLVPPAASLGWNRMMLMDAAETLALQSGAWDDAALVATLRRRAFRLGFHDIHAQPEAVRVEREEGEAGPLCRVLLDFTHRPRLYGWDGPVLRIRGRVQAHALPVPEGGWRPGLVDGPG